MRPGVWLALACAGWCSLGACSGGYPLAPTPCDEYCDATYVDNCPEYYSPAGCVSDCERSHLASTECRAELDQFIACYKQHPQVVTYACSYDSRPTTCDTAVAALSCCATKDPYACAPLPTL